MFYWDIDGNHLKTHQSPRPLMVFLLPFWPPFFSPFLFSFLDFLFTFFDFFFWENFLTFFGKKVKQNYSKKKVEKRNAKVEKK